VKPGASAQNKAQKTGESSYIYFIFSFCFLEHNPRARKTGV